jgi:hypothetical protein
LRHLRRLGSSEAAADEFRVASSCRGPAAEQYFELGTNHGENWHKVLARFTDEVRALTVEIAGGTPNQEPV